VNSLSLQYGVLLYASMKKLDGVGGSDDTLDKYPNTFGDGTVDLPLF